MHEDDDRGLQDSLHRALIRTAASIDGVTPLEIARVAADGPVTPADVETFLSSVRLTARLRAAWKDRCPSPSLLARSIFQPGDTPERRELAEAIRKMVALHAADCPQCTSLLTVLSSDLRPDTARTRASGRSGYRLPDPRRSRAVLIGTGKYADDKLPDLPVVGRTISDLAAALTDPVYGVVPENHCTVLEDQRDIRLIDRELGSAASHAEDLLLVYFTGHGLAGGRRHELYLGLTDSEWAEPEFNSLEYDKLRSSVLDSAAATKIIILDCCFSGRVVSEAMADPVTEMVGQIEVDGTYVLASAGRDQVALIRPGEDHTAFTGRFLDVLRNGVPGGPELLTVDDLYRQLVMRMKAEGLSQPQKRGTSTADLLALAGNRAFAAAGQHCLEAADIYIPRVAYTARTLLDTPERKDALAASFWDVLDPPEREVLRSVASWRTFAAGAMIMEEGERADHVMVILGGRVKVCVDENGHERVLAVRGLGQLVGERAALQVSVRSATVIALDMVWALIVQTRDFAAFISAHPRVLDIVQAQLHQRAEESAGYGHDHDPGSSRAGIASSTAVVSPPGDAYTTRRSRRRPRPLTGENCTVFLTDVVEFGARTRTDSDRLLIREALFKMTQAAMQGMPGAQTEDRGDGFLTVIPPIVSTPRAVGQLLQELPGALERHNRTQRESARFKLRLAMNVGPVVSDTVGVSGEAIIVAGRLVEAPSFKEAITESTAGLGVIASPFVYEAIIRHGTDPREVADYSRVPVEVKESATTAWMKLFNAPVPSPLIPRPAAHGHEKGR